MSGDVRILILDDHQLVREGYLGLLHDQRPEWSVSGVSNSVEFFEHLARDSYSLAIIDLTLKEDMSGLEILRRMKSKGVRARTLILSMHDSSALIEKSLQLGASGFINKQAGAEELFEGIRTVLAGRRFLCSHSQKMFVRGKLGLAADLSPLDELSKREFEIFVRLAEGQATRDIADSLSVSPKTVANQRLRIFEKLKVKSVVELYKLALHYRILPDEFVE